MGVALIGLGALALFSGFGGGDSCEPACAPVCAPAYSQQAYAPAYHQQHAGYQTPYAGQSAYGYNQSGYAGQSNYGYQGAGMGIGIGNTGIGASVNY